MGKLWIDGTGLEEFGITVSGEGTYNAPELDYETVPVPGRNGELIKSNGRYKNITVTYPAGITQKFRENAAAARAFLLGAGAQYRRLVDSYHPDTYRMGIYTGGIDFSMGFLNRAGETSLAFNCMPQRFLMSGEDPITPQSGQKLYNAWMEARPLLLVTGNGTLTVGTGTITVADTSGQVTIDCDLEDAYQGLTSLTGNIEVENNQWPVIPPGESLVSFTGITQLQIIPRWWTL